MKKLASGKQKISKRKYIFLNMKKFGVFFISLLLVAASHLSGQEGDCPKIKVGVDLNYITEDAWGKIMSDNANTSFDRAYWLNEIQNRFINALNQNNPSVSFIDVGGGNGGFYEYIFKYSLYTARIAEGNYDYAESVVNEYSALYYEIRSIINSLHKCGPSLNVGEHVENKSRNLSVVIEANVVDHFSIQQRIKEYEGKHPVPPRAPEMTVEFEPEFVSPLKEERKAKVKVTVVNCEGRPVYYPNPEQWVSYDPYQSEKGKMSAPLDYSGNPGSFQGMGSNTLIIYTKSDGTAIADYELQHGMAAGYEPITITTCGLVSGKIKKEKALKIKGLEMEVRPVHKEIYWDEQTDFILTLKKIDPDGVKDPVSGKELKVKIEGLVNGEVNPKSGYVTDNKGDVRLHYRAGDRDEKISVTASFQPEDYPDKAEGKGFVLVKEPEGDFNGTITYKRNVHWKDDSEQESGKSFTSVDNDENVTINVAARYLRTIRYSYGVSELYEATPLSGNFSLNMTKTIILTDKKGHWTKKVDKWQGGGMLESESGSNLLITIEPQKKSYSIQGLINLPSVKGITEITTDRGTKLTMEAENWRINASFNVDGPSDGNSIRGNMSKPAIGTILVSPLTGFLPGTTWNWSLSRTNKKSN